ncbi:hypothetical protein F5144DRAFT_178946 [Chaetomium tenue]|uniref:Uncharacterized protein n=1 Tax=Chaetomium tenue TaxID=1854479 RepID=A0ACB7PHB9_9PEZI|nr:hypothetical protein F5144DRAFT_178946 [Chaetomium globosum]
MHQGPRVEQPTKEQACLFHLALRFGGCGPDAARPVPRLFLLQFPTKIRCSRRFERPQIGSMRRAPQWDSCAAGPPQGPERLAKTNNIRDSLATDPAADLALASLIRGERTGSRVFWQVWSYVRVRLSNITYKEGTEHRSW